MKYILVLFVLFLVSCAPDTKIGERYRVKSGFYAGCVGWAASSYAWTTKKTMLKDIECVTVKDGFTRTITVSSEYFENSELEPVGN